MRGFIALLAGLIFGLGLTISSMVNPSVVRGFLDVAGEWNPSLMFVLGGAVLVSILNWRIRKRYKNSISGEKFPLDASPIINSRLILGTILFGIGWGLVGLCPGPAVVSSIYGGVKSLIFLVSMFVGFGMFHFINKYKS